MPSMKKERLPVFVYGTLRPGEKNYLQFLAGRAVKTLAATAEGRLFYVADGGYPYVEPGPGKVVGELVYLDPGHYDQTLQEIDALEEYNPDDEAHSVYLRRRTRVTLLDGSRTSAWIYYWNFPELTGVSIVSGNFRDRPD